MQQKTSPRWTLVATMSVCVLILVALVAFQSVVAQGQSHPVPVLKPPFKMHADDNVSANAAFPPMPPSADTLLEESFGTSFDPHIGVITTTTTWQIFTDTGAVNYYWNRVIPLASAVYSDTAWAACGTCDGTPGTSLDPDTDNYPDNQGTWMIYGPLDLSGYYAAAVTFNYSMTVKSGDTFWFGVSNDGTYFTGSPVPYEGDVSTGGWLTHTFGLSSFAGRGKPSVYLGFYFRSNSDGNAGKGVFVDNVVLRAVPYRISYLPSVAKNFSVATPTPTITPTPTQGAYRYLYTYDTGLGENDPDFKQWGGSYSSTVWEQGLVGGYNSIGSMYMFNTRKTSDGCGDCVVTFSGANLTAPANFEITADVNVYKGRINARYGIVFGAESATFSRGSGGSPQFNINTRYYRIEFFFPTGSAQTNDPNQFKLARCDGVGLDCADVVTRQDIPAGANMDGSWDKITVRRNGSSIVVLVNNYQILSTTDGTYSGSEREFGVFVQTSADNGTGSPLEIDWDNYRVAPYP